MDFITHRLTGLASGVATEYIPVPYRCVISGATIVCCGEAANAGTITLSNGATAQATVTVATTSAADVKDMTVSNSTVFEAGTAIKITTSAGIAAVGITILIKLNPYLAGVAGA